MRRRSLRLVPALALLTLAGSCDDADVGLRLSDRRIVLTPGGSATLRIRAGGDDTPGHPVQLRVRGLPEGVSASWETLVTEEHEVDLVLTALTTTPLDGTFQVGGRAGPFSESSEVGISVQIPGPVKSGAEEHAPGVSGEVKSIDMGAGEVVYEVIDGTAIVDADIVLGPSLALEAAFDHEGFAPRSAICNYGFATEFHCQKWTDGVIGYSFANDWGSEEKNAEMRGLIEGAIAEWETETGIRFARRAAGEYLEFRNGDGCSSNVGRSIFTGIDSQSVSLKADGCNDHGIILHEIGHAIGLYHEQSRDDRDEFVAVDFGQIIFDKFHQFYQKGEYERDRGPYDYGSIMHYKRDAFVRDESRCTATDRSGCSIKPDEEKLAASGHPDIGQRDHVSEGDILGVYTLYPPQYAIRGASDGDAADRFVLSLDYDTPRPRADRIEWKTDRHGRLLGTGHSIAIDARDVPLGVNVITANFVVLDTVVTSQNVILNLANEPPNVSIYPQNGVYRQPMGQPFLVFSEVTDPEAGACEPPICTYGWLPDPNGADGNTFASFTFDTEGPHSVGLVVEDRGGVVGSDTIEIETFNSAPTVSITEPDAALVNWTDAEPLYVRVEVSDPNTSSGSLDCDEALTWSSTNPADSISPSGCRGIVNFDGPGTRTISVFAEDPQGLRSAPDSVDVYVPECAPGTLCAPVVSLDPATDPSVVLAGGIPGWFIENDIAFSLASFDPDGPGGTVSDYFQYRVWARPACGTPCDGLPDVQLGEGLDTYYGHSVSNEGVYWTPSDDLAPWPDCEKGDDYRLYEIVAEVTDPDGQTGTSIPVPVLFGCAFI